MAKIECKKCIELEKELEIIKDELEQVKKSRSIYIEKMEDYKSLYLKLKKTSK
jgi:hypothetical protein